MDAPVEKGCYCGTATSNSATLVCERCSQLYHIGCLKYGRLSTLQGDTFFTLVCARCSDTGEETYTRMKLSWQQVVTLILYNLHLGTAGRQGYFHWKEHICATIVKYWMTLFGNDRKKTATWCGTVAGTLSSGCPVHFRSGTNILKESGWWALNQITPPTLDTSNKSRPRKRQRKDVSPGEPSVKVEGLRRRTLKSSIDAAIALKAKRDTTQDVKEMRRSTALSTVDCHLKRSSTSVDADVKPPQLKRTSATSDIEHTQNPGQSSDVCLPVCVVKMTESGKGDKEERKQDTAVMGPVAMGPVVVGPAAMGPAIRWPAVIGPTVMGSAVMGSAVMGPTVMGPGDTEEKMAAGNHWSERQWLTERGLMAGDGVPEFLLKDDDESDLEIDPCTLSSPTEAEGSPLGDGLPQMAEILAPLSASQQSKEGVSMYIQEKFKMLTEDDVETTAVNAGDCSQVAHDVKEEVVESETTDIELTTSEEAVERDQVWLSTMIQNDSSTDDPPPSITPCSDTESETKSETESESEDSEAISTHTNAVHIQRRRKLTRENELAIQVPGPRHVPLSQYEERELLRKMVALQQGCRRLWRLRGKMLIRQRKRERGLVTFDLDRTMGRLTRATNIQSEDDQPESGQVFEGLSALSEGWNQKEEARVLDRFQILKEPWSRPDRYIPFRSRLVGFEDDQLDSIRSPYTARLLKPFIRRDSETMPLKLKLLTEIQAYGHRCESDWTPDTAPIDYCYVRPQHVPSINNLCSEFFWPGIDLSECLQYPDFSCVVLYRHLVIGFAFMVPDVKYNEAYISFLFTHPEWAKAGIGHFMIYHLIQTCMGKDVTLHVSADNPAMLLYQKFGFKPQELILGFYDRYFADDSHQSRHAFFMRLQR